VWQHWIQWGDGYEYALRRAESSGTRLMLHLSTAAGQNVGGVISPGEIARGEGDRYLVRLGERLSEFGGPVYLRLFGEMNNCDLAYSSHDCTYIDYSGRITGYTVVNIADLLGDYDWRLSDTNVWKAERVLLEAPHRPIRSSDTRIDRLRRKYVAFRKAHDGRKPLYYKDRHTWSEIPHGNW
jgi:hypothetical protein